MNDSNNKSSLFNFDPSIVALLLWIISIIGVTPLGGIFLLIGCFVILKNERESTLLRNHTANVLTLSIVTTIVSTIIYVITRLLFFSVFLFMGGLLSYALGLLVFALALLGALKAYKKETYSLPIIGIYADQLEQTIRP